MWKSGLLPIAAGLLLTSCVMLPTGPSVTVLPGDRKDFEQFKADDAACRQWALQQTETTASDASTDTAVSGAAIGTALGAAGGTAVGAAAGSPATGAAVGSGVGLLSGTAVGAERAEDVQSWVQQRYDVAYMQCMYAKGNQVPIPKGSQLTHLPAQPRLDAPPPNAPVDVPPRPAGSPPLLPSEPSR